MSRSSWAEARAGDILGDLKHTHGPGWKHLSDAQRSAYISERVLTLVLAQDMEQFRPAIEMIHEVMAAAKHEPPDKLGTSMREAVTTRNRDMLVSLRISVARAAQAHGVDNELKIHADSYEELAAKAQLFDRGWGELASLIAQRGGR